MRSEQSHEMQLAITHSSGAEEWNCPECGRRFVAQWEPNFRRVILERGDEMIIHNGQGMGFREQTREAINEDEIESDVKLSDVWKQLLDKLDFGTEEDGKDDQP